MNTATLALTLDALPALGAPLDAGTFRGLTTRRDGTHCAVVLLPDKPAKKLAWSAAMAWAAELNAELPTRPVAALLFANARDQFDRDWHWCAEEHEDDGSFAWLQYFGFGSQYDNLKSYEGRARAVRLIPLGT